MFPNIRTLALASVAGSAFIAPAALAQSAGGAGAAVPQLAPDAHPATDSSGQVGEIIVTAQKRAENLQRVPIAITVATAASLARAAVSNTQDLQVVAPSLMFNSAAGSALPRLRGVGSAGAGPGIENPVATYVDGVYIASMPGALLSFNNIAQVAILKGPQGTLFGRNATGGLIQITTLDPKQDFGGSVNLTYGNHDTKGVTGYVTAGIAPNLAADLSVYINNMDGGFGHNIVTGSWVGGDKTTALRSKIMWDDKNGTVVRLIGDYSLVRQGQPGYRPMYGTTAIGDYAFTGGKFDVASTVDPEMRTEQGGVSLDARHDFDGMQLVSITAYRRLANHAVFDQDRTPANLSVSTLNISEQQFSQEFQLVSKASGPLKWVLGAYYFYGDSQYDPYYITGPAPPSDGGRFALYAKQLTNSYAGFGQATYEVAPGTNLTAGLRYTSETRQTNGRQERFLANGTIVPLGTAVGSKTFDKVTWRLSLDHQFDSRTMGYISYNRGFKSGAFNPQAFPASSLNPEVLDAYEIGLKSEVFDRRLRLNGSFFYYDYKNIQLTRLNNGIQLLYNANSAEIYGAELEAEARVTSQLTLSSGLSWTHGRYGSIPSAVTAIPLPTGGNRITAINATGNDILKTPDWAANVNADYRIQTMIGLIRLNGNAYYNDGWFNDPDNRLRQPSYTLYNASVVWTSDSDRYSVSFWGKNLSNVAYATTMTESNFADSVWIAPGRTFGVTAGVKF